MDPGHHLPLSVRLDATQASTSRTSKMTAHVMPFSVEYTGPAPIDTYFLLRSPANGEPVNANTTTEAVSAFRGRKMYGSRFALPTSYNAALFRMQEEVLLSEPKNKATHKPDRPKVSVSNCIARPRPVHGARFSLDEDEEEEIIDAFTLETGHDIPTDLHEEKDMPINTSESERAYARLCLKPEVYVGKSIWIWGPDGPIDAGDDVYMRTCKEWVSAIAPALHDTSL